MTVRVISIRLESFQWQFEQNHIVIVKKSSWHKCEIYTVVLGKIKCFTIVVNWFRIFIWFIVNLSMDKG